MVLWYYTIMYYGIIVFVFFNFNENNNENVITDLFQL